VSSRMVKEVLVIGGGVSGLTTALELAERRRYGGHQFNVKVFAEHYADEYNPVDPATQRLVSTIAGALWEFPPAVCGMHGNQLSIARSEKWCMTAYRKFRQISDDLGVDNPAGVSMPWAYFYFGQKIDDDRVERLKKGKLEELSAKKQIRDFRPLTQAEIEEADDKLGGEGEHVQDGYAMILPVIETPTYMKWLLDKATGHERINIIRGGGKIPGTANTAPPRITDRLAPQEQALRDLFDVQAIVNCSGLGAAELAGASMIPLRGALVAVPRVKFKDGKGPQDAFAMAKTKFKQDMIFIVPRKSEVIIGGFAEPSQYQTDLTKDYHQVKSMFERSRKFLGDAMAGVDLKDPDLRLDVGLRPYRAENVCVEREYDCNIVHNYGHTGSGFTFSYGCAEEAADLVESMEGTAFHTTNPG
jgi:D-amino-acid oxidase